MGALYLLSFPNGKEYIGITSKTAAVRFAKHWKKSVGGQDNAINRALLKYGKARVAVRTLVVADDWAYLCEMERRAIQSYGTFAPGGYNSTLGGEGVLGLPCAPETRKRISRANTGRKLTDEQRARISEALRKRPPVSAETRAKLSAANTGRVMSDEVRRKCGVANVGRVITAEEKAKQRATVYAKGGGVCFDTTREKWLAYVKVDRKTKILGRFSTQEAARAARTEALELLQRG